MSLEISDTNSQLSVISNQSEEIGVLIIGVKGAVATTLISACTQAIDMPDSFPLPSESLSLASSPEFPSISRFKFGGWDISELSFHESLEEHNVLPASVRDQLSTYLDVTLTFPALSLDARSSNRALIPKVGEPLRTMTERIEAHIQAFRLAVGVEQVILVDLSSTNRQVPLEPEHQDLALFESKLDAPYDPQHCVFNEGMLYVYAGLKSGCPCINFTPTTTFDIPALINLAEQKGLPLCGKDGKTGQTLYKTALAPMFKARALKVRGWYSANILGNRDGIALKDPERFQTKRESKEASLTEILGYDDFDHQVHIHYYRPRGDNKEAWDTIDFDGWFGTQMQMKINWLGSDSILAAPLVADLIRWMSVYQRIKKSGLIAELAPYFKTPLGTTEQDLFKQLRQLEIVWSQVPK